MGKKISTFSSIQPNRHVVIAVHGIRTFADWYGRLRSLLKNKNPDIEVEKLHFGYFSFFLLIFPWFRKLAAERYADILINRLRELDGQRIDIVAHSFGTFIVATALDRLKREAPSSPNKPIIQNLILSGSVLKHSFLWRAFCPTFVRRIVNDCGTHDVALLFGMFFLVGLGYGGRRGFDGIENLQFFNRYFKFGHSGFFEKDSKPYDQFMIDNWLPILIEDQVNEVVDPRNRSRRAWLNAWLETWADPLKMTVHIIIFVMLPFSGWLLYSAEREANFLANANLDAAHAMATVTWDGQQALQRALSAAEKHDSPEINQALKATVDIAAIPTATLTHGSPTGISRATAHPILPIFAVSFSLPGRTIVSIIDAPSGKEVESFSASMKEEDSCHINSQISKLRFSPKGNYVILESIAGACIWSLEKKKIIYSDLAREKIDMNADESLALVIDGSVSGTQRLDLLDVKSGKLAPIGKMPMRPFDDIKMSTVGMVRTTGESLIFKKFGQSRDQTIHAKNSAQFQNLFVSAYSDVVVASTEQGEVVAVDPRAEQVLWRKSMKKNITYVDFSRDGTRIACQLSDGSSVVLRASDGAEFSSFPATGFAEGVSFVGSSSDLVLTNNRYHDLKIWNVENGSLWRKISRDIYQEGSAVTANGEYLIAGERGKKVVIWRLIDSDLNATYSIKLDSDLSKIAVDAYGGNFIALDTDGNVSFGNSKIPKVQTIKSRYQRDIGVRASVSLDSHGTFGVVEDRSGIVKVINLITGKVQWSAVAPRLISHEYKKNDSDGEKGKVDVVLFYQDKDRSLPIECPAENDFLNRTGKNGEKIDWKKVPRTCFRRLISEVKSSHVMATSFYGGWARLSPSGKYVVVSVMDMLMVLDSQDGHLITTLSLGYDSRSDDVFAFDLGNGLKFQRLKKLEFLDDDSIVALTETNAIFTWEKKNGDFKEKHKKALPSTWIFQQISSATSMGYFQNVENGDVLQIDLRDFHISRIVSGQRITMVVSDEVSVDKKVAIVVSEEPELIIVGQGAIHVPYKVEIRGASNLKKISEMKEEYPIHALAFSHDGVYVAVGTSVGLIRIYEVSTGKEKARIQREEGVRSLAFTNNDLYILSTTGPSQTYPATAGTDKIQFDMWRTSELRRVGCKVAENENGKSKCPM